MNNHRTESINFLSYDPAFLPILAQRALQLVQPPNRLLHALQFGIKTNVDSKHVHFYRYT